MVLQIWCSSQARFLFSTQIRTKLHSGGNLNLLRISNLTDFLFSPSNMTSRAVRYRPSAHKMVAVAEAFGEISLDERNQNLRDHMVKWERS